MYTNVPPPARSTHATNYMTHEGVFPIPTVPDSSRVSPRGFFSPVSFRTRLAQGCTLPFPFMRLMIWRGFIRLLWLFTICHNRAYSASEYNPLSHDMGRSPCVSRHGGYVLLCHHRLSVLSLSRAYPSVLLQYHRPPDTFVYQVDNYSYYIAIIFVF